MTESVTAPGPAVTIRVADERDVAALAGLRRAWLEEREGHPVSDPGFEAAFEQWWRVEQPRRTFWLAEAGTDRSGFTAIGSINVVEIVHMPRPGARGGRIGHAGQRLRPPRRSPTAACPACCSPPCSNTRGGGATAVSCSHRPRGAPRSTGGPGSSRRTGRCWCSTPPPSPPPSSGPKPQAPGSPARGVPGRPESHSGCRTRFLAGWEPRSASRVRTQGGGLRGRLRGLVGWGHGPRAPR